MAARKKIALFYTYQEGWIGGTYYIQNLVHALQLLPDPEKPELTIICRTEEEYQQIALSGYPYLNKWLMKKCNLAGKLTVPDRLINKISWFLLKKNIIQRPAQLNIPGRVDVLFPCPELKPFIDVDRTLYWIPDLQEIYLPDYFDRVQLQRRHQITGYIARNAQAVLFSSHDVFHDFEKAYPNNTCNKFVVPFAVTHPDLTGVDFQNVQVKYGLNRSYFFAPNQFWKHKDHLTLIKAAARLIQRTGNIEIQFIFSGKEDDFRNPGYAGSLKKYVQDHQLSAQIRFLGFIDRTEQLSIMKNALAVVQPSLFEGWSTVVEDAKALNKYILASDLNVHREQLIGYPANHLFRRSDDRHLSELMFLLLQQPTNEFTIDYRAHIVDFAANFMAAVNRLSVGS